MGRSPDQVRGFVSKTPVSILFSRVKLLPPLVTDLVEHDASIETSATAQEKASQDPQNRVQGIDSA